MQYDAIIIGAGISGLYQLHCLRKLGLKTHVFESGTGVGGTWYWNRYPGARFDSESYSYGYSFSQELLDEWDWTEHFSPQPKTLEYLNFVADKFDLRRDITFSARVTAAHWHEQSRDWHLTLEDGSSHSARFLITAIGPLSAPTLPTIEGIDSFKGLSCHTARFPKEPIDFTGKRVAVIGTGATGVQTIQEVAEILTQYPDILERCRETFACFLHTPDPRGTFEVTPEERAAKWEQLYGSKGFGMWQGNFRDILTDRKANALLSAFVANKIRERVKDPATADRLIPKNHGFGTRRVPLETKYYEVYNQTNVRL